MARVLRLLVHVEDVRFRSTIDARATVHELMVQCEAQFAALMPGREPVVVLRIKDAEGCFLPGDIVVADVINDGDALFLVHDAGGFAGARRGAELAR